METRAEYQMSAYHCTAQTVVNRQANFETCNLNVSSLSERIYCTAVPVNIVWTNQLLHQLDGNRKCKRKRQRGGNKHSVLKSHKFWKLCLLFTFIDHRLFFQESILVILLSAPNFIKGIFVELRNPDQGSKQPRLLFGITGSCLTGCGHTLFFCRYGR